MTVLAAYAIYEFCKEINTLWNIWVSTACWIMSYAEMLFSNIVVLLIMAGTKTLLPDYALVTPGCIKDASDFMQIHSCYSLAKPFEWDSSAPTHWEDAVVWSYCHLYDPASCNASFLLPLLDGKRRITEESRYRLHAAVQRNEEALSSRAEKDDMLMFVTFNWLRFLTTCSLWGIAFSVAAQCLIVAFIMACVIMIHLLDALRQL